MAKKRGEILKSPPLRTYCIQYSILNRLVSKLFLPPDMTLGHSLVLSEWPSVAWSSWWMVYPSLWCQIWREIRLRGPKNHDFSKLMYFFKTIYVKITCNSFEKSYYFWNFLIYDFLVCFHKCTIFTIFQQHPKSRMAL